MEKMANFTFQNQQNLLNKKSELLLKDKWKTVIYHTVVTWSIRNNLTTLNNI